MKLPTCWRLGTSYTIWHLPHYYSWFFNSTVIADFFLFSRVLKKIQKNTFKKYIHEIQKIHTKKYNLNCGKKISAHEEC